MLDDTIVKRMAERTHCERGHAFTGKNVRIVRGYRTCVECNKINCRARYAMWVADPVKYCKELEKLRWSKRWSKAKRRGEPLMGVKSFLMFMKDHGFKVDDGPRFDMLERLKAG